MSLFKMLASCLAGAALAGASFALLSAPNPANSSLASTAPKVASVYDGNAVDNFGCTSIHLKRTISTPTAGLLTINAQALIGRDNDDVGTATPTMSIKIDGEVQDDSAVIALSETPSQTFDMIMVKRVNSGNHTVVMTLNNCSSANAFVYDRTLVLEWTANFVHKNVPPS